MASATDLTTNLTINEPLMNPEQAAEFLGVTVGTLYTHCQQNTLPHLKVGKLLRFRPSSLAAWVAANETAVKEAK